MVEMKELPKKYNHKETEQRWQGQWQSDETYRWNPDVPREDSFVIDTPPPTVSGLLHMGHIFSYTQADFVARFQRMTGKNVFYPMGFDDNGLPTERLVEKVKKIRGSSMPREEFISVCQDVVTEAEEEFRALFRSAALSVDWSQEYQTISKNSRTISQLSFLELAQKDRAYRQLQPTLWDPIDRTALAQADVEDKELPSVMHEVFFSDAKNGARLTVATTRPELLAACVAVLYHPEDERYQHLSGGTAISPLFGVSVPLVADEQVEQEKGSGLVMCCTFGDITDIDWWKKHKFPTRVILDKAGRLGGMEELGRSEAWPSVDADKAYQTIEKINGLKIKDARQAVIDALAEEGLLGEQTELSHYVKCAERSGSPLEILVTPQWFVKVLDKKEELLKRSSECNWYPSHMKIRLDQWIEGLNWDWCISRQRFFGVPFPVWYSKRAGEEGKILFASPEQLPVDPFVDLPVGYSRDEVEPDQDVMDTWATSSVSPQLSSHGIAKDYAIDLERHQKLFPADLRPQAHEIIRSWAFYTIVKADLHEQTIPWKNLMISGWCLASDKTKMSKSKGNVVTPVHLIEEKGSDVVRYWASTSRLGSDTAYSEDVLKIGKKLVNKLWNAAKFASIHLNHLNTTPTTAKQDVENGVITEVLDQWILSRLHKAIVKATKEFERFEYCLARMAIEDFFWNDFCDNYLEMAKSRAYDEEGKNPAGQQSAACAIYHCLDGILRLFAPFVPHITEELYQAIFAHRESSSLHIQGMWPSATDYAENELAESVGVACVSVLDVVRKTKAEKNVSIKTPLSSLAIIPEKALDSSTQGAFSRALSDLQAVSNANACVLEEANDTSRGALTEGGQFYVEAILAEASDAA